MTGQFSGTLFMLIQHLILTYAKISSSQLINLKLDTEAMHYDPQTTIGTFFTRLKTSWNMENLQDTHTTRFIKPTSHTPSSTRQGSFMMK